MAMNPDNTGLEFPNFLICDKYYGEGLDRQECFRAIQKLPQGQTRVRYGPRGENNGPFDYNIPMQKSSGERN